MVENRYILATDVGTDKSPNGSDVIINVSAARNIVREPDGTVVFWFDGQHTLRFTAGGADKVWALVAQYCGVAPVKIPPIEAGQPRKHS